MAGDMATDSVVRVECVCGNELRLAPELLGRIIPCPHCRRYVRPSLHFVLVEPRLARNLTVQCTCGRFVVGKTTRIGKTATCEACRQRLVMPQPTVRENGDSIIRIPPSALKAQLRRSSKALDRYRSKLVRLRSAANGGRVRVRPGENICVNPDCGAVLRPGANVCTACGTNLITGRYYRGVGPGGDPSGKWKWLRRPS